MKINVISDCRGWDVEDVIDQVLSDRHIEDPYHFLNPTEDDMLPLTDLRRIDEAAAIVLNAIKYNGKIGILADVDLDGITSGAIIYRYLSELGANLEIFINHGKAHGLQTENLHLYKDCDIFIIVDSLDSTIDNYIAIQKDSNITDVIVLDHHAIDSSIPYDSIVTLVSSQRDYGNPALSGAGVCMKFVLYLDRLLGLNYANSLYDLAAAGEVADMMDMTQMENRYIVSRGLESAPTTLAIKKLVGNFKWDSKSIAFSIAPVVNASMRFDENDHSLDAFISDDNKEVLDNLKVVKKCREVQNIEVNTLLPVIEEQIQTQLDHKMLFVTIETEHGISGLIGNKLLAKYKRPIVIVKDCGEFYAGSMRAVGVDDFRQMINDSGLAQCMGHELAAGIEIKKSNLAAFIDYIENALPDVGAFEESIDADVWVNACDIDQSYIEAMQQVNKVSGTGFLPVKVYLDGITDYHITDMSGGKHLVIELGDSKLKLIKWNFDGNWELFQDAELFGDELEAVLELQCGFIGRTFMLQGIIDYIGIKE